ncbi:MAG: TonB-dependent receptor [Pseudomonadota bacterium]
MLENKPFDLLKRSKLASAVALATLPAAGLTSFTLHAQEESTGLEEIVVTASRRAESLQDVPINIAAVDAQQIESLRLTGINDIARYVPGLTVLDRGPRDERADLFVRGLNTTALGPGFTSDTVATYFGDIPLFTDFATYDLERVEVLIGPQGTLYGQGTLGGAIRYIPKEADSSEFDAYVSGGFSKNSESSDFGYDATLTLNFPLIEDTLALRANVHTLVDPGFIDYNYVVQQAGLSNPEPDFSNPADRGANLRRAEDANGEDTVSIRLNMNWTPSDTVEANFWYLFENTDAEGRQIAHQLALGTGPYESGLRYEEPNEYENQLFAAVVEADLGFADATFVYGHTEYEELGQRDQTDLLLNFQYGYEFFPTFSSFTRETDDQSSDTFEIRMTSKGDGPFSWTAGLFYYDFEQDAVSEEFTPFFDVFAVAAFGGVQTRPDSLEYIQLTQVEETEKAFYGEISYDITDSLTATLGYRAYEFEVNNTGGFGLPLFETVFLGNSQTATTEFVNLGTNVGDDDGDLFKFNVSYDIDDDNMVYFTYSEGYRNGGVNAVPECTPEQLASTTQQLCAQADEVFIDPDTIDNYELGYKGQLLDNRLRINAAIYYIDWQNLQVDSTTALGSLPITGNGSEAESKGIELSVDWLINDNLKANFNYENNNAELTEFAPGLAGPFDVLAGSRLPGHADQKLALNLTYTMEFADGELDLNYGLFYYGDVYNGLGGPEDTLVDGAGNPADRGYEEIPDFDLHNVSATYRKDNWSLQAYVENLFDEYYITGTRTTRRFLQDEQNGPGNSINGFTLRSYGQFVGDPLEVGIRFTYDFE